MVFKFNISKTFYHSWVGLLSHPNHFTVHKIHQSILDIFSKSLVLIWIMEKLMWLAWAKLTFNFRIHLFLFWYLWTMHYLEIRGKWMVRDVHSWVLYIYGKICLIMKMHWMTNFKCWNWQIIRLQSLKKMENECRNSQKNGNISQLLD